MFKFLRNDEGLTLIELLVVIALVGVVATISLPILINTVQTAQSNADATSVSQRASFASDWTTAGYAVADGLVANSEDAFTVAYMDADGDNVQDAGEETVAKIAK